MFQPEVDLAMRLRGGGLAAPGHGAEAEGRDGKAGALLRAEGDWGHGMSCFGGQTSGFGGKDKRRDIENIKGTC
ncbi:MAG: hypothetical protein Kow0013_19640 [Pararhodobacter sp.]